MSEDEEIYSELQKLNVNVEDIKRADLGLEQLREILQILKRNRNDYFRCHYFGRKKIEIEDSLLIRNNRFIQN